MSERSESVSVILSKVFTCRKMYHIMVTTGATVKKKKILVFLQKKKKKKRNAIIIMRGRKRKNKATSSRAFHLPQRVSSHFWSILFISHFSLSLNLLGIWQLYILLQLKFHISSPINLLPVHWKWMGIKIHHHKEAYEFVHKEDGIISGRKCHIRVRLLITCNMH